MAKIAMRCPFSGMACKNCAVYRGRHYYLCFSEKYRGTLPRINKNMSAYQKKIQRGV